MFWPYLLLVAAGLVLVMLICLLPGSALRIAARLGLNCCCGLALLLILNTLTALELPLNALTLAVSSFLGAPGIAAVAAIALI